MISNVAQLVSHLIDRERAVLAKHAIRHGPTIGRMYEGLTKKAVELTIPTQARLLVAGGFIRGTDGKLSDEQDVIIAFGDHEQVPHTDSFIFDIARVIAVIEVKKVLGRSTLAEAVANLNTILAVAPHVQFDAESMCYQFQDTTHRLMTNINEADRLVGSNLAIFNELFRRRTLPLRIILGYEGYSTEYGLRVGLSSLIADAVGQQKGRSIQLPDAILAVGGSIVTSASRPWAARVADDGRWPYLLSNGYLPPAIVLLEMLWTRLSDHGIVKLDAFGEDLDIEPWSRFMDLEYSSDPPGWMLNETRMSRTSPTLVTHPNIEEWRPAAVSDDAAVLIMLLARESSMSLDDLGTDAVSAEPALRELEELGLVGRHVLDPSKFGLLTRQLVSIIGTDGRTYAGENVSGRLVRWMIKHGVLPAEGRDAISALVMKVTSEGIEGVVQPLPVNGIGWTELITAITGRPSHES